MKSTRSKSRAGMTLLEVAICVSLLTLIIVPVFGVLLQSRQTTAESRHFALARSAIQSQIEQYKGIANQGETPFGSLAQTINAASTFVVPGLPRRAGGAPHGVVRVCLDENKQYFNATDAAYFGSAPFNQIDYPAYHQNLNGDDDSTTYETLSATPPTTYRVLPLRLEVYWGQETTPKIAVHAVIAPRSDFIRG